MPDNTGLNEVLRFMASPEGKPFLEGIRKHLAGRTITGVEFTASGEGITTVLRLDNGECYAFNDEELSLETLREQFNGLFRKLERKNKEKRLCT
jgi:hypothetical protein